jgi:hypothetical protein
VSAKSRATGALPFRKQAGGRGPMKASMRPSASAASTVSPGAIGCTSKPGGSAMAVRSPPERQAMPRVSTPYCSRSIPRNQSAAVCWYSGMPMLRPATSSGRAMPRSVRM